jgi:hypothetical protein
MPYFAYQYGYSCEQCHSTMPRLNHFGTAFRLAGYRLPGLTPAHGVIPLGTQSAVLHSSEADPTGLPKTILDYLELNSAGPIGHAFDYFANAYVIDGGRTGALQDAWIEYSSGNADPDAVRDLRLKIGQFYLPLPVSAETYRETINHYAAFDQTVGSNPFNFFDPKLGLDASIGAQYTGASLHLIVTRGHDYRSALPPARPDVMLYAENNGEPLTIAGYALDGTRDVHAATLDDFQRYGAGATVRKGKAEVNLLLQSGWDSASGPSGMGQRSSAGFVQLRWGFSPALAAVLRGDAANGDTPDGDTANLRTVTSALIFRTHANSKLVLEGVYGQTDAVNMEFFLSN